MCRSTPPKHKDIRPCKGNVGILAFFFDFFWGGGGGGGGGP